MSSWRHGIYEMFCLYNVSKDKISEYSEWRKDENGEYIKDKNGLVKFFKIGKKPNPCYIKGAKRPLFCKKRYKKRFDDMCPQNECLYQRCPFLSYIAVTPKEFGIMMKAWNEYMESQSKIESEGEPSRKARIAPKNSPPQARTVLS